MAVEAEKVSRERFEELVADEGISLAHRALWSALWDGEARVADWLRAQIEDVGLPRRRVHMRETVRADTPEWVPVSELTASLPGRLMVIWRAARCSSTARARSGSRVKAPSPWRAVAWGLGCTRSGLVV